MSIWENSDNLPHTCSGPQDERSILLTDLQRSWKCMERWCWPYLAAGGSRSLHFWFVTQWINLIRSWSDNKNPVKTNTRNMDSRLHWNKLCFGTIILNLKHSILTKGENDVNPMVINIFIFCRLCWLLTESHMKLVYKPTMDKFQP